MDLIQSPLSLSVLGLLAMAAGPLSFRIGLLQPKGSFLFLLLGLLFEVAAAVWAIVAAIKHPPGPAASWVAIVIGVLAVLAPISGAMKVKAYPMIHDISTDTIGPPEFVTTAPARSSSPNGVAYGGPEIAAKQREAYPDIQTLRSRLKLKEAYDTALATIKKLGWKLASNDLLEGAASIEATDTTLLYGFKDDVVIRIQAEAEGSRLDMRSASRIGLSDLGKNAARIREFREAFLTEGG